MLQAEKLTAGYVGAPVIRDISLELRRGEVVCLLGANGAGKTTIARTLAGIVAPREGTVAIDGVVLTAASADRRVRRGLTLVPEERHLFGRATVRDNLVLGGFTRSREQRTASFDRVLALFPQLERLLGKRARDLSGGEQQMVAIGRALMAEPHFLILDEPSLGLAPLYVDVILQRVAELAAQDVGVLLIEQNVGKALAVSDRGIVIETGRVVLAGAAADLATDPAVVDSYLGKIA